MAGIGESMVMHQKWSEVGETADHSWFSMRTTDRTDRMLVGDHLSTNWHEAGLVFLSVATGSVRTIRGSTIARRLGVMPQADMQAIDSNPAPFWRQVDSCIL